MHASIRLILVIALLVLLVAPTDAATLLHTWVASTGTDSPSCGDVSSPCASFQGAYDNTTPGGEIACVDSGEFSGVTITGSITINCENAVGAVGSGGNGASGYTITTSASDIVLLKGLDIDGFGKCNGNACNGSQINFTGAGTLHLQNLKINHLLGNSFGVNFQPSGSATLDITDSNITDNGNNNTPLHAAGINIRPGSGVQANVTITRTQVQGNYFGVLGDGTGGGGIRVTISDSVFSGNTAGGIAAISSILGVEFVIDQTKVSGNGSGLYASGSNTTMLARFSTIFNNTTGLDSVNGGRILTSGYNTVIGNTTNGAFTGTETLQ